MKVKNLIHLNRYCNPYSSFLRPTSNLPRRPYLNNPGSSSSAYIADFSSSTSFCSHPYAAATTTIDFHSDTKLYSTASEQIHTTMTSAGMERGIGGRIETAFACAKDRGEAAFVSFVTAGYPTAQGEYYFCDLCVLHS